MMEIIPVITVLADAGLEPPTLNALVPNVDNYRALLLQPHGDIEASILGVWNRDRDLAYRQYEKFLGDACHARADLVVTPEYSIPWKSLTDALKAGVVPAQGKLWAFGCESIKYRELEDLRDELSESISVIFEPLDEDNERFLSPLAYVFNASTADGSSTRQTVVLVQFKTHPMGDPDHFEVNAMQRGTSIYQFGGGQEVLKLTTLICADVFAFKDSHAEDIYDRGLILHIQLNAKPRHERFLGSRERIFGFGGDATEVICLNWASNVCSWHDGKEDPWNNNAASAWYLKSREFDDRDETLCQNHRRGVYYTWHQLLRTHTLFLNFDPATFLFEATKVAHIGVPGAVSRRRGPQLIKRCVWNNAAMEWNEQVSAEAGFSNISGESGGAEDDIKHIAEANPLAAERVLALCAGGIASGDGWCNVRSLDSCVLDASEVIRRVTFCQDTDASAQEFRIARLKRLRRLWTILQTDDNLPPSLQDVKGNVCFTWSPDHPHQNIVSTNGQRATAIYMGEDSGVAQVEKVKKNAAECLRRFFSDDNERQSALQRLAVWYRDENDQVVQFDPHRYVQIDETAEASEFDIGRER